MTIIGKDNRTEVDVNKPLEDPIDSVVAIDTLKGIDIGDGLLDFDSGSGILISPKHVLTAAHVIENGRARDRGARVTLAENVPNLAPRDSILSSIKKDDANASNTGLYLSERYKGADINGNRDTSEDYDLGLITLNDSNQITDSSRSIGLLAFEDPKDALNYDISTAGYPGLVRNVDVDRSKNAQYIVRDENGKAVINVPRALGSLGTAGKALFTSTGTVDKIVNNSVFSVSESIDLEPGQSGSGFWTTLEGDDPRVLGVLSSGNDGEFFGIGADGFGVSLDVQSYHEFVDVMEEDLDIQIINDLPENAIIGSNEKDEIKGTYRKERILGNDGNDTILGGGADDRLEGGLGNDILRGEEDNDLLQGDEGNDFLYGGEGDTDVAVFSDDYTVENYEYKELTGSTFGVVDESITFEHIGGTSTDGKDTLENIEFAQFGGNSVSEVSGPPRIIPLPLEDGVEDTESVRALDTTPNPDPFEKDPPTPPYVSLTAPVAMLDGDIDYTLNISPYKPDIKHNIAYIIDNSESMDAFDFQNTKDAYINLTNYFIDTGIAENANFGVIAFGDTAATLTDSGGDKNLTADEAKVAIQSITNCTASGGERCTAGSTNYSDGLYRGWQFIGGSRLPFANPSRPDGTTGISYFFSDGRHSHSSGGSARQSDSNTLRRFSNVQAFGLFEPGSGGVLESEIDFADSNEGVLINNITDLSAELQKSGLAGSVESVNILVDGEVVDTILPEQLTDSPLGLTYEGSVDELDVSIDAENVVTAEVVYTPQSNLANTAVDFTVTAGDGKAVDGDGNPIDESGNDSGDSDPFERTRNGGGGDDEITLGYADKGASGGAGGDKIVGNKRDNILDGGAGNDTIFGHGGDDMITTGAGDDKVDGGEGIDTVVYEDVYGDGSNTTLNKVGNTVVYNNSDTLTDVEFIQLADVRFSTETLEITPVIEVSDIRVVEGNAGNTKAQFTFELSTPAPVDVVFDYSTADIEAMAGSDYVAKSETLKILKGQTTATVDVDIIGDSSFYDLPIETFALNLSGLSGR